nr:MAG TPA: hypothetical protein [Caudoviricetes sp.]
MQKSFKSEFCCGFIFNLTFVYYKFTNTIGFYSGFIFYAYIPSVII